MSVNDSFEIKAHLFVSFSRNQSWVTVRMLMRLECFPFLLSRHSSRSNLLKVSFHTLNMTTALSPDILQNLPDPFSMPADISYSVILRSQLLTTVLAAWPSLSAMQHRKSFYSLQKQTWTIKGTLSIRIIIWHYSGDTWCSHGSMGGHSGEGRAQGCKVNIFYNLSDTHQFILN